jgi:osmotically-inducible protein OsmY
LLSDVRERFNNDPDLRSEPILIAAKDGVVTLSGEVSNPRTLDRALQLAAQTPGVDSVVLKVVVAVDRGAGR